MKGLDTNVLVRYLTQDEPSQARKATALVEAATALREKLHLDAVVLCELVWVLRGAYGFDKARVVEALEKILGAAQFSVRDRDLVRQALAAYREGGADFADYVLGTRNIAAGCTTTVTFDRARKRSELFQVV
jgi:predicted nucleic-acid-binding protein